MLVLAIRPGTEDIVIKTGDGDVVLHFWITSSGRMAVGMAMPDSVSVRRSPLKNKRSQVNSSSGYMATMRP